ncbi:protein D1-like [Pararge aegeria]|uniref:protein D1-like n=1 Tax=Pararge aegeria TaxID=116150 RepID=UPI0019CFAEC6|nr:protein D1-like [Pararge aegeria]XP_039752316.1 protein D1-like [Pararge aegeria]
MFVFICLTILQLITGYVAAPESMVAQAFQNDKIVSKVVLNPPSELISVTYPGVSIYLGTTVQPLQTLAQPVVSYEGDDNELYTLMFFGPDLPPSVNVPLTQFLHWLVVNIPGRDISKGDTISSYFPPTPYPGGFPYIFILYKQDGMLNTTEIPDMSFILRRPNFSPMEFAEKYNLNGPIAGNFMHESYLSVIPEVLQTFYNILGNAFG